jgi:hypothetical protein
LWPPRFVCHMDCASNRIVGRQRLSPERLIPDY